MKKTVLCSAILSVAITAVLCAINWISAIKTGRIIGITTQGGEHVAQYGFGVIVEKIYPMISSADPTQVLTRINPEPISFVVTLLAVFVVALIILRLKSKKKG